MHPERLAVFFPCHSLDDFPIWLDEPEADELLAAWTAAWHPALIAAVGAAPGWMSVEVPPSDPAGLLGIVPPAQMSGVNKVLNAAAWTYVAATLQSILTLLYYASYLTSSNSDSER